MQFTKYTIIYMIVQQFYNYLFIYLLFNLHLLIDLSFKNIHKSFNLIWLFLSWKIRMKYLIANSKEVVSSIEGEREFQSLKHVVL